MISRIPSSGLHASYYRHETGNMVVRLHCLDQELVALPGHFKRVLGIDYMIEAGCREISPKQATELGFVFPSMFSFVRQQNVI